MKKRNSFTLIEMLVTVMIVVIITAASVVSLGAAKKATNSTTGADEVKSLIDELKSYSTGPEREKATYYILIIKTSSGSTSYCNNHSISQNQYLICATTSKAIPTDLNGGFYRVRADHLQSEVDLTPSGVIIYSIRTNDGQMGYYSGTSFYFPETAGFSNADQTIGVTKDNFTKNVIINPFTGTTRFQ